MLLSFLLTIVVSIIAIVIIFFLYSKMPFYFEINRRYPYLEALRGISALSVIFSHSILAYGYQSEKIWWWSNTIFENNKILIYLANNLGSWAVSIFFMLTSFLFFDRFLGKSNRFDILEFYRKRIFRLVPMYLFSILLVFSSFLIIGVREDLSFYEIIRFLISWLSFGYWNGESISARIPDGIVANAGVLWTLAIEWKFYILFPLILAISPLLKWQVVYIPLVYLMIKAELISEREGAILVYFIMGYLAVYLNSSEVVKRFFDNKVVGKVFFTAINLVCCYTFINVEGAYNLVSCFVLGMLFISVVLGNSLCQILTFRFLMFLGMISYSLYLLHGIILNLFSMYINVNYTLFTSLSIVFTVIISMFTFKNIEYKFMK